MKNRLFNRISAYFNRYQTKSNQQTSETGRSMVEMLGVLMIIGVLSIAGIYGYNKGMNQIALNKQGQQVSDFCSGMVAFMKATGHNPTMSASNFKSSFVQLGYMPDSMIPIFRNGSEVANKYWDYFGNAVQFVDLDDNFGTIYWNFASADQFVNMAQRLQQFSDFLYQIVISGDIKKEGNRTCQANNNCFSTLTLSDLQTIGNRHTGGALLQIYFYRR